MVLQRARICLFTVLRQDILTYALNIELVFFMHVLTTVILLGNAAFFVESVSGKK